MKQPHLRSKEIPSGETYVFKARSNDFPNLSQGDFESCIAWSIEIGGAGAANATVEYRKGKASASLATLAPNGSDWSASGIANKANVLEWEIKAVSGDIVVNMLGLTE